MPLLDRSHRRLLRCPATAALIVSDCRAASDGPAATACPGAMSTAKAATSTGGSTVPPQVAGDLATHVAPHLNEDARTSVADLAHKTAAEQDRGCPLSDCTGETEAFGPFDAVDQVITLRQGGGRATGSAAAQP